MPPRLLTAVLLAAVCPVAAAPIPEDAKTPPPYFPTTVGAKAVYQLFPGGVCTQTVSPARAGTSPVSPASPVGVGTGDAGDTGDVPAQPESETGVTPGRRRFRNDDREHDQRGLQ
ncbi:hypothetical protein J0H58_31785 [bacterium]|nr:hypothetical protein [bacterium]